MEPVTCLSRRRSKSQAQCLPEVRLQKVWLQNLATTLWEDTASLTCCGVAPRCNASALNPLHRVAPLPLLVSRTCDVHAPPPFACVRRVRPPHTLMSAFSTSTFGTFTVNSILSGRCAHLHSGCLVIASCTEQRQGLFPRCPASD